MPAARNDCVQVFALREEAAQVLLPRSGVPALGRIAHVTKYREYFLQAMVHGQSLLVRRLAFSEAAGDGRRLQVVAVLATKLGELVELGGFSAPSECTRIRGAVQRGRPA